MTRKLFTPFFYLLITLLTLSSCHMAKYGINYTKIEEPRYAKVNIQNTPSETPATIKIVSYNIEFAKKIDLAVNLLQTDPNLKDADIIFLQEMDDAGVKQIAEELQYNYIYYPAVFHPIPKQNFGNAVLSKWPITYDEKILLEDMDPKKLQRIAANAIIEIGPKKIFVSSIHMRIKLQPFIRRRQIAKVIHSIPESIDHCIIAGDFNTFHSVSLMEITREFKAHTFTFATQNIGWTHKTWYTFFKKSATDHIFTRGFNVKRVGKTDKAKASDHIPVWATLEWN